MSISSSGKVKWSDISTLFTNLNTARAKFFPSQSNFSPSSGGQNGVVLAKLIQDLNGYIESFSSNSYVRTRAKISQNPPNTGDLISPTIINTFLEKYDFTGKKIVLFATSGGSGFGNTVNELKISAPDAVIVEGKVFHKAAKQEIAEWVRRIL